ncbi:hypothetical protein [Ammoniphilus resinae]|uniref:Uncharacterized protein n=1 Tax=Ammoniphilus resinae TaxID=861532 RepID=A0ABS4GW67_9BACL|nr:hypothetical protein [Ammoniphilus resinae]MBP1934515.1 hypothetical protein [Ammoniphilus resinae]
MKKIMSLVMTTLLLFTLTTTSFAASEDVNPEPKATTSVDQKIDIGGIKGEVKQKDKTTVAPTTKATTPKAQASQASAPSSTKPKDWSYYLQSSWAALLSIVLVGLMVLLYGRDTWAEKRS